MLPESLDNLYYNINYVAQLIRKPLLDILKEYRITPEQFEILQLLQEENLSQSQITNILTKDKGNVSRIIKRLKIGGLVDIRSGRRANNYVLTPKAIAIYKEITKSLKSYNQMLEAIGKEQGDDLLSCIKQAISKLK